MNSKEYQTIAQDFIKKSKPTFLNVVNIICNNPNITIEFVKNNLDEPLNWTNLSSNISISLKDIYDNIDLPWNFNSIFNRDDMTKEYFFLFKEKGKYTNSHLYLIYSILGTIDDLETLDESLFNLVHLSYNPNINVNFVKKYIHLSWNWHIVLFQNKGINYRDLLEYDGIRFNFLDVLLENISYVSFYIIKEYLNNFLDNPMFWANLSRNKNLPSSFIEEYIDKPWFWSQLSCNTCISPKIIKKYIDKPWDFDNLSSNPKITIELVKETLHKRWNWFCLSRNDNIKLKDILDNLNLPWSFTYIMYNRNIKFRHLQLLEIEESKYRNFVSNPNLTFEDLEFIERNNDYLDHSLFLNQYKYDKKLQILAKNTIIRYYRRYKLNYKLKHLSKQSYLVDELKYKPNLGVEFFKTMRDIDDIFLEFKNI